MKPNEIIMSIALEQLLEFAKIQVKFNAIKEVWDRLGTKQDDDLYYACQQAFEEEEE